MAASRRRMAEAGLAKKRRGRQGREYIAAAHLVNERLQSGSLSKETLARALTKVMENSGECRRDQPFMPLYPVLDDEGLRYCCEHDPTHCSEVIGG